MPEGGGSTVWFTVLAIIASVLSAGGIISQVIAWWKTRDEKRAEVEKVSATSKVELAKVEAEDAKNERDHTGRFQRTLIERVEKLEQKQDAHLARIALLETDNEKCQAANAELRTELEGMRTSYSSLASQNQTLAREHETLKTDHEVLKRHVAGIEHENRTLRTRLGRLDDEAGKTKAVEPEQVGAAAHSARSAAKRRGE